MALAPKINLCGKVTHPTATSINEDPWEQRDYYLYPFMDISLDTSQNNPVKYKIIFFFFFLNQFAQLTGQHIKPGSSDP